MKTIMNLLVVMGFVVSINNALAQQDKVSNSDLRGSNKDSGYQVPDDGILTSDLTKQGANDIGVSATVPGQGCNVVTTGITNFSGGTSIPGGTDITLYLFLNNTQLVAETLILEAPLLPGETVYHKFSYTIPTKGVFDFKVQAVYNPDPDTQNNEDSIKLFKGDLTIGGANPDFVTIHDAVNALKEENATICGHINFKIRNGQHPGQIHLNDIVASSSENTITFESESGNPADVVTHEINIIRTEGVRIKKLTISKTLNWTTASLYFMNAVKDVVIEGNVFKSTASADRKIAFQQFESDQTNILIKNNLFETGAVAIQTIGNNNLGYLDSIRIESNLFLDNEWSVYMLRGNNVEIIGNTINSQSAYNGVTLNCQQAEITKNEITLKQGTNSSLVGIHAFASLQNLIANNIIDLELSQNSTHSACIFTGSSGSTEIYHNTVSANKVTAGKGDFAAIKLTKEGIHTVQNNIIQNLNGAYGIRFALEDPDPHVISHNDYHVPNGAIAQRVSDSGGLTITYNTLQYWQQTGHGQGSLTIQPQFANSNSLRLHLLGNESLKGKSLPIITHDIDGQPRNLLSPYMGADEIPPPVFENTRVRNSLTDEVTNDKKNLSFPEIVVYPNPAVDELTLDLRQLLVEARDEINIQLFDLSGVSVFRQDIQSGASEVTLNLEGISKGTYLIVLQTGGTIQTEKVIFTD